MQALNPEVDRDKGWFLVKEGSVSDGTLLKNERIVHFTLIFKDQNLKLQLATATIYKALRARFPEVWLSKTSEARQKTMQNIQFDFKLRLSINRLTRVFRDRLMTTSCLTNQRFHKLAVFLRYLSKMYGKNLVLP